MWILSCTASTGYLSRMTQWKVSGGDQRSTRTFSSTDDLKSKLSLADSASLFDKTTKSRLKLGLFSYPVLQAADILLYG